MLSKEEKIEYVQTVCEDINTTCSEVILALLEDNRASRGYSPDTTEKQKIAIDIKCAVEEVSIISGLDIKPGLRNFIGTVRGEQLFNEMIAAYNITDPGLEIIIAEWIKLKSNYSIGM